MGSILERLFAITWIRFDLCRLSSTLEGEGKGAPSMLEVERKQDELLSDEELRERIVSDQETKEAIKKARAKSRSTNGKPGITAEELPDFLREHG
jgi:hypothetical protein